MDLQNIKNHSVKTGNYLLKMRPLYALLTFFKEEDLEINVLKEIRSHLKRYYAQRDFIMINKRRGKLPIDPRVYKNSLRNMRGVAIVSTNPHLRDLLIEEQKLWKRSFAHFKKFSDARKWALDCFDED